MSPSGRTSHTATMTASSSTATTEVAPTSSVLRRAASTNWPKLCTGLPTLTAPAISWPRRIGAATYITDVLAVQRAMDLALLRPVLAGAAGARVEHDPAGAVGHDHAQLHARLLVAEDVGLEAPRIQRLEHGLQRLGVQRAVARGGLDAGGHQVRGFHQRFLGRLAVARVDVAHQPQQQHAHADRVGQQDADEDAGALGHASVAGRSSASAYPVPRWVRIGSSVGAIAFIFARKVFTWASTVRSRLSPGSSHTRSSSVSRVKTWPGRDASVFSRPYS